MTTSQAISFFLTASVNRNGLPFELTLPTKEEQDLAFATAVTTVDGVPPDESAQKIIRLYSRGDISYEEAQSRMEKLYKQE